MVCGVVWCGVVWCGVALAAYHSLPKLLITSPATTTQLLSYKLVEEKEKEQQREKEHKQGR